MIELIISVLIHTALAFVAALGALQIAALRGGRDGLSWPFGVRHKLVGHFFGSLMLIVSFAGAGALKLVIEPPTPVLSAAAIFVAIVLALGMVILGASLRLRWNRRRDRFPPRMGQPIELGPLQAFLYQPEIDEPVPGVCLFPDPTSPEDDLSALVRTLVWGEISVLLFDWRSLAAADRLTFHGLTAVGISYLTRWPGIDATQVGLVGVGLGGDLALRSAVIDPGVAAVLAIEPVLSSERPGAGLEALSTLSWFEARRRARRWKSSPLIEGMNALAAVPSIAPRPAAIVVGCAGDSEVVDNLDIIRAETVCSLTPTAHTPMVELAAQWLKEHLTC